jgi:hypothetical protein
VFLSRSSHAAVMAAKDEQIATLKSEVAFLRGVLAPAPRNPNLAIEADAVLEGRQEQIEAAPQPSSPKPHTEHMDTIRTEAALMLSGNY